MNMIKVLIDQKVVKLNSLNDLDLETLVTKCKSYDDDGDGIILGIVPVTSEWKEYYENRFCNEQPRQAPGSRRNSGRGF